MYTVETFELGLPDWGVYRQNDDPARPVKEFPSRKEAEEFASNLSATEVCLARVLDSQKNVLITFDNAEVYDPGRK